MTDLVKFEELQADLAPVAAADGISDARRKQIEFNMLMNHSPRPEWIKEHPTVKVKNSKGAFVPLKYIPVEVTEYLLTAIYLKWRVEIKEVKQVANSICVTVRLHYQNPIDGEWEYQDGTGAVPLQTDVGAKASDMIAIKSAAVQIGAPAAESFAIKDAAGKIGRIFGKDLNKDCKLDYSALQEFCVDAEKEAAFLAIKACEDANTLSNVFNSIGTLKADAEVVAALKAKKESLKANSK